MVRPRRHQHAHGATSSSSRHPPDHRPPKLEADAPHRRRASSLAGVAGASVMSRARVPSAVAQHCRAINALVTKLEHAARKVDEYQRAIGQHIAAIKKARPDDWEDIVKAECKLGRSRAYE